MEPEHVNDVLESADQLVVMSEGKVVGRLIPRGEFEEAYHRQLSATAAARFKGWESPLSPRAAQSRPVRTAAVMAANETTITREHLSDDFLEEARAAVDECLSIDPKDDQARYFSALLDRRENKLEAAEGRLRDLIASEPRHPFVRYACRYELAQILDRNGQCDDAMRLLGEAKQIVRGLTDTEVLLKGYDEGAEKARRFTRSLPKTILRTWGEYFPERKREPIPRLAFLGGHPRSGTTLLEQVLDAHPGVAALDEPTAFLDLLQPEGLLCPAA